MLKRRVPSTGPWGTPNYTEVEEEGTTSVWLEEGQVCVGETEVVRQAGEENRVRACDKKTLDISKPLPPISNHCSELFHV